MANGHGGRRAGAGRKPKSDYFGEPPVTVAVKKIRDRLPALVDVALDLAITDRDPKMVIYCIDRVLGKPVDRQEHGDPGTFKQGYTIRLVRTDEVADDGNAAAS